MYFKYSQEQLSSINELIKVNLDKFLDEFGVQVREFGERFQGKCPVHGGNNITALSIRNGYWTCFSHHCEKVFNKSLIGFIRGLLSHDKFGWIQDGDKTYSFYQTIDWILAYLKVDINTLQVHSLSDAQFLTQNQILNKIRKLNTNLITREEVRRRLEIPAEYLLQRGFSKEILDKFDCGLCIEQKKWLSNRVVVPIYDDSRKYMIGALGRSIYPKCSQCEKYHSGKCPPDSIFTNKWLNSKGFNRDSYLFNYWNIQQTLNYIILVEGPLDVLKLEENKINNGVAIFGSEFSDGQLILLEKLPIQNLIIVTDSDKAGDLARQNIRENCCRLCKVYDYRLSCKDFGEAKEEQIIDFKRFLETIK